MKGILNYRIFIIGIKLYWQQNMETVIEAIKKEVEGYILTGKELSEISGLLKILRIGIFLK